MLNDTGGRLPKIDALKLDVSSTTPDTSPAKFSGRAVTPQSADPGIGRTAWIYQGIRIETPDPLTLEQWKKVVNYVSVQLKPGEVETKENN